VRLGEAATIEALIEEDRNCVNARGANNRTALHKAVGKNFVEVARLLIDNGADITLVDGAGMTPLYACEFLAALFLLNRYWRSR